MKEKKKTLVEQIEESPLKSALTGAAAGTAAALITNPVAQISNMKASHPSVYGNKSWREVAVDLWNKPNYTKDQKIVANKIDELRKAHAIEDLVQTKNQTRIDDLLHEISTNEKTLAEMKPKTMKLRSFYSGFGSKALNNALFSAAMFGSLPIFKGVYDNLKDKRVDLKIMDTNG